MTDKIREIRKILKENSDPVRAEKMSAYMRNKFAFYGIPAAKRRDLTMPYIREGKRGGKIDWDLLFNLFKDDYREMAYLGLDILKAQKDALSPSDFESLIGLSKIKPWWDTIDLLDGFIGKIALMDDSLEEQILDLAQADNFWLRRIAIGHQRRYKEKTDTDLLEKIIKINLQIPFEDKDEKFFIEKSIGWALREYSKTNPTWVKSFLDREKSGLPPLSRREASKYL